MGPTSLFSWSPRHHVGRNSMRSTVATRVVLAGSNSCGAPANVVIGKLGGESIAVRPQENRRSLRSTRMSRAMYEKLQSSPIVTMDEIEAIELSNPLQIFTLLRNSRPAALHLPQASLRVPIGCYMLGKYARWSL